MTVHYTDDKVTLHHGDCLGVLRSDENGYDFALGYGSRRLFPDDSVDAVVTDPPYGIRFMGAAWDGTDIVARHARGKETSPMPEGVGGPNGGYRSLAAEAGRYDRGTSANRYFQEWCEAWAAECLRVLKPGGHLLSFGSPRTWHRLTSAVEDAGFEIRDSIAWLYGSGFPKSLDVSKAAEAEAWKGWGTALKPAFEPVVVARKPLAGTVASNVLAHGTGALNIDATRVNSHSGGPGTTPRSSVDGRRESMAGAMDRVEYDGSKGRWPTNVVLDESQADVLDQQSGERPAGGKVTGNQTSRTGASGIYSEYGAVENSPYGDTGGASRFFPMFRYEAKAGSSERPNVNGAVHPTVKPLALMRWLVRLVTPPGGVVLEPFAGSGTTVEACLIEGFRCLAIEREAEYLPLILARVHRRRDAVAAIRLNGEDLGLFGLDPA